MSETSAMSAPGRPRKLLRFQAIEPELKCPS